MEEQFFRRIYVHKDGRRERKIDRVGMFWENQRKPVSERLLDEIGEAATFFTVCNKSLPWTIYTVDYIYSIEELQLSAWKRT